MNLQSYYETKKIKTMKLLIDREIQKQTDRQTYREFILHEVNGVSDDKDV